MWDIKTGFKLKRRNSNSQMKTKFSWTWSLHIHFSPLPLLVLFNLPPLLFSLHFLVLQMEPRAWSVPLSYIPSLQGILNAEAQTEGNNHKKQDQLTTRIRRHFARASPGQCSPYPSSRKRLLLQQTDHYRKPQLIKMQGCGVQSQQIYKTTPTLKLRNKKIVRARESGSLLWHFCLLVMSEATPISLTNLTA